MRHFKEAIVIIQYSTQPTISWLYVIVQLLFEISANPTEFEEIQNLCQSLSNELHKRFDYIKEDSIFLIAAYIDPATTGKLDDNECKKAKNDLVLMVILKSYYFKIKNFRLKSELKNPTPQLLKLICNKYQNVPALSENLLIVSKSLKNLLRC